MGLLSASGLSGATATSERLLLTRCDCMVCAAAPRLGSDWLQPGPRLPARSRGSVNHLFLLGHLYEKRFSRCVTRNRDRLASMLHMYTHLRVSK